MSIPLKGKYMQFTSKSNVTFVTFKCNEMNTFKCKHSNVIIGIRITFKCKTGHPIGILNSASPNSRHLLDWLYLLYICPHLRLALPPPTQTHRSNMWESALALLSLFIPKSITKSCSFHLFNVSSIHLLFSLSCHFQVIIIAHLDFSNSLLVIFPACLKTVTYTKSTVIFLKTWI